MGTCTIVISTCSWLFNHSTFSVTDPRFLLFKTLGKHCYTPRVLTEEKGPGDSLSYCEQAQASFIVQKRKSRTKRTFWALQFLTYSTYSADLKLSKQNRCETDAIDESAWMRVLVCADEHLHQLGHIRKKKILLLIFTTLNNRFA